MPSLAGDAVEPAWATPPRNPEVGVADTDICPVPAAPGYTLQKNRPGIVMTPGRNVLLDDP
jgi:hypothetical protein